MEHLLHVGYPRTGSTFLRRWFAEHPQLAYREATIAGYRNVHDLVRESFNPRRGVLYRVTSYEGFTTPYRDTGTMTVAYEGASDPAVQENVCASLAALFPNAHVLLVTRGFRSVILSSLSQYARFGGDVVFEQAVDDLPIDHLWDYDRMVGIYRKAFGDKRLIVMPYELLRDDVDRFMGMIEARLGLTQFRIPLERVNPSLSPVEMYWYPRISRIVHKLPIGSRLKAVYLHGALLNRFRHIVFMLQKIRPGNPVTADAIPDKVLDACRGKARTLCADSLYAPYVNDYS